MPNRILKESICTSETIEQLSWEEEAFFYRLITVCDDFGRFDGRASVIRARCFPLRLERVTEKNIGAWVRRLEAAGLVRRYEVDGRPFVQLVSWDRHQQVRSRRAKYPAPPESVAGCREHAFPSERDVEDLVFDALAKAAVVCGVKVLSVGRQVRVGESYLDIVVKTESSTYVYEIKRGRLGNKAIEQLGAYVEAVHGKGILVGNGLAGNFDVPTCIERDIAVVCYDDSLNFTIAVPSGAVDSLEAAGIHVTSRDVPVSEVSAISESESQSESETVPSVGGQAADDSPPFPKASGALSDEERVMLFYNEQFRGLWERPLRLTPDRKAKIRARLATYTVEEISRAIKNIRASPYHCGENEGGKVYATPEFICRNDGMVDKWLNVKPRDLPEPKPVSVVSDPEELARLRAEVKELMTSGSG